MCNWPAGVFGNSLFSKANKKKRCKSREMPALIKLHRSVFIDTVPGGSQRDSQSWRECGKHTRQLSEEAMIPTITEGGGGASRSKEGCTRRRKESIWHWFVLSKEKMCTLRGFVRFPPLLPTRTDNLSVSKPGFASLRHPDFCCAFEQFRP